MLGFLHCWLSNFKFSECNPKKTGKVKLSSCSASSEHDSDHSCDKSFDGDKDGKEWAITTDAVGIGSWIKINFDGFYRITKVKTYPRSKEEEMFKDISLEFGDETTENFTLGNVVEWSDLVLNETAASNYVKITGLDVYGDGKNGFKEIEVFGCAIGEEANNSYINCQ